MQREPTGYRRLSCGRPGIVEGLSRLIKRLLLYARLEEVSATFPVLEKFQRHTVNVESLADAS